MENIPFNDLTALGLLALVIVLAYYALNKLSTTLGQHLERMESNQNRIELEIVKCAERLDDIQESFQKSDK